MTSQACGIVNQLAMEKLLGAGADEPRLEPARAPQIGKIGPEAVEDAGLRPSVTSWPVVQRDIDDASATKLAERGQVAMDPAEVRQPFDGTSAIRLERAADVGDRVAEHNLSHAI